MIESIEDFRKRYRNTYVFLLLNGKKQLVLYEEDDEVNFHFYSPKYGSIIISCDEVRELISLRFPEQGLYNVHNGLVLFSRYPARQWKRAPCGENVSFKNIQSLLDFKSREPTKFTSMVAEKLFYPDYPESIEKAFEKVTSNSGIAINKDFGVTISIEKLEDPFVLWYRNCPVGTINPKNHIVTVHFKPLFQETFDFFMKGDPFKWTVNQKT